MVVWRPPNNAGSSAVTRSDTQMISSARRAVAGRTVLSYKAQNRSAMVFPLPMQPVW
jgi:hypothetical protein